MKCPKCGNEIKEGKLLCEFCGEEVKVVPDYDIEVENEIKKTLEQVVQDFSDEITSDAGEASDIEDDLSDDLIDDELKSELKDYFFEKEFSKHLRVFFSKKVIVGVLGIFIAVLIIIAILIFQNAQKNTYSYQYDKAVECATQNLYDEAVIYLEHALVIEPDNAEGRFLLAKYYDKCDRTQSAIKVLNELLQLDTLQVQDKKEEIYDLLLSLHEKREEYQEMGELLKMCDIQRIITKYNKYMALQPVFNKQEGVYDELISITLESNTKGIIYYTLDGTNPTKNSHVYESPILLESGDYVVKAFFVNMYGVESDIITKTYYINLTAPQEPVINLDSGSYTQPQFIEIFHAENTKIFYTVDGTTPTSKSMRYTEPIEMPYGVSNFAIIAIDDSGLASEVIKRTYQLSITANFTPELSLQVLMNNLLVSGEILDMEGHVSSKLGVNTYTVQTAVKIDDAVYYIVKEVYVDTVGKSHNTNNLFAINADTAQLYTARKISEGEYLLNPFNA